MSKVGVLRNFREQSSKVQSPLSRVLMLSIRYLGRPEKMSMQRSTFRSANYIKCTAPQIDVHRKHICHSCLRTMVHAKREKIMMFFTRKLVMCPLTRSILKLFGPSISYRNDIFAVIRYINENQDVRRRKQWVTQRREFSSSD